MGYLQKKNSMNKAATKMERIKTAAKATRQTGERVAVSCAGAEVAFVPVPESEALERVEETLDMDAVKRNREQDKGKKSIPWKAAKKLLNL